MNSNPENFLYNLKIATRYLKFAIHFTPQYGDSFLETIKVIHLLKSSPKPLYSASKLESLLEKTKQNCLHSEPNYGILWFYYKESILDNAFDIWKQAEKQIPFEMHQSVGPAKTWVGSHRLACLLEQGLQHHDDHLACLKIIYGHEQILPVTTHN